MHTTRARTPRLLLLVLAGILAAPLMSTSAAAAPVVDGSESARAAASCWEIKQNQPGAADGVYWLITPGLKAPGRFYCDMTTDGGGWVLVGRGRDGWMWDGNGTGTIDQVSATVTGTAAFSPRQLSNATIDGLLGGRRLDSLTDGVRLRRAANTAGTSWQETRFTFRTRDRWSWAFGAGHPISSFTVGGSSGSNSTTRTFGTNNAYNRVATFEQEANNWVRGFLFGQSGFGTNSQSSYIYSNAGSGQHGAPFTQVFLRPRITTADLSYDQIPDSGTNAETAVPVAENGALPATWGVTGTGAAGTDELATEVQAFAQIGNTMFVGGNFTTVQRGEDATGANRVDQSYLAAFNATTGDWISSFRPTFNNQVRALTALPGGKLAVGGEFTSANGSARAGLVVLDASSGNLDPLWDTNLENRIGGGGQVSVRGLDTSNNHLYVAGAFTHFVRGTSAVFARHGARLSLSTGRADAGWNPNFQGTATAVDVDDDNTRAYFSGYFTSSGTTPADRGAAVSTGASATLIPWTPTHSTSGNAKYQQAVRQIGDLVWLAGSQHNMFAYDTGTFELKHASVSRPGGDLQAIDGSDDVVYGGCHCGDWNYETTIYDGLSPGQTNITWTQADKISLVGAWDAVSGKYLTEFAPQWKSRRGFGVWALKVADDGTLWAGGSLTSAVRENGSNQWVGGFARFDERPHTAPDRPSNLSVDLADGTATVSWARGSTSGASYEVLRNDRVVAITDEASADVPDSDADDRFFVRAADGNGNRSASTSVEAPSGDVTVLAAGSSWRYLFDNTVSVPQNWRQPGFDDSSWSSGEAPLGWGSSGPIETNIDVPAGQTRALTSYHRTSFTVADPSSVGSFLLSTRADDGLIVYVNGTEVRRVNLPAGTVTANTYATAAPSTSSAIANPVTVEIPKNLIQSGANTIAVEVHSNYRSTPNTSIEATIEARP
jgi:hypothetical protein